MTNRKNDMVKINRAVSLSLMVGIGVVAFASCIATTPTPPLESRAGRGVTPTSRPEAQEDQVFTPTASGDAGIQSGSYHRVVIPGVDPEPIALEVVKVEINRQDQVANFELRDGSTVSFALHEGDSPVWGRGCPTNVSTTRMEVLYIDEDRLTLDGVTFEQPVLVATCPAPPLAFVLREAGSGFDDILPSAACDWWQGAKCIYFSLHQAYVPAAAASANPEYVSTIHHSKPRFQVFILNPVRTCLVGNDFASGNVCRGRNCGDCLCTWEQFDPPAPLVGIPPSRVNDPQYAGFEHKVCLEIKLTQEEIDKIIADMDHISDQVFEWSDGALDLQMDYTILPHDHVGFVAPDFVFGPFEVDDELLDPLVTTETDFVYVVTGVHDLKQGLNLAYACGGSYGEMSIRGAGYANIQYSDMCNSVMIGGRQVYEPLIHEWMHNLDWALYEINQVPDSFQHASPDWANWRHASWPACGKGAEIPLNWFPSVDFCEWDPDWIDCNNVASAGACLHAGELGGEISWYEHVISVHYPRDLDFIGNYCRDGRRDISETGIDQGWPCP